MHLLSSVFVRLRRWPTYMFIILTLSFALILYTQWRTNIISVDYDDSSMGPRPPHPSRVANWDTSVPLSAGVASRNSASLKTLLFWDSFKDLHFEDGDGMFQRFKCPEKRCRVTRDRKELSSSAAVLFHMRETVNLWTMPEISSRSSSQKWVFAMKESPVYSEFDSNQFNGIFDWTMSYRLQSDIPWPYGSFSKRPKPQLIPPNYHDLKSHVVKKDSNKKISPVAWIVSRCHSESKREVLVKELRKYIDVDVYGKCGSLVCSRVANSSDSCNEVPKKYHFYLAFENSLCPDYVTEKLYKIMAMEELPAIPVVFGGANYSLAAPPGSVIDASSFSGPRALAKYLNMLLDSPMEYNSYHEWRKIYRISTWGTPAAMCLLCMKVHLVGIQNVTDGRVDLDRFWSKKTCGKVPVTLLA